MRKRRYFFELQCYNLNVCNIKPCHIYLAGCHNFDFKLVTWVYNVTFRLRLTHQYNKPLEKTTAGFFYTRFLLSVVMFVFNVRTKVNSWNFMVYISTESQKYMIILSPTQLDYFPTPHHSAKRLFHLKINLQ